MKIILIDNYDSFTFNLYHYLSSFSKVDVFRNDKVDHRFILKKRYDKIVISPGPGDITILLYLFFKIKWWSTLSFLKTSTLENDER